VHFVIDTAQVELKVDDCQPLIDGVYARIGTGDSIETNASTFMVEMRVRPMQSTKYLPYLWGCTFK